MKQGFSFIELIFVLMIIGILASFAYPSYKNTLFRARRSEAQTALFDLAQRMEDYYFIYHSYKIAKQHLGQQQTANAWYNLSIEKAKNHAYRLHAIPIGVQANDVQCQTLTLDHTGQQGLAAGPNGEPQGTVANCW